MLIDTLEDGVADGFNDLEFYGEWYPTLSFGRLADRTVGGGPVRDVALIGGLESQSFWFTAVAYYGRHVGRSRTTCRRG